MPAAVATAVVITVAMFSCSFWVDCVDCLAPAIRCVLFDDGGTAVVVRYVRGFAQRLAIRETCVVPWSADDANQEVLAPASAALTGRGQDRPRHIRRLTQPSTVAAMVPTVSNPKASSAHETMYV